MSHETAVPDESATASPRAKRLIHPLVLALLPSIIGWGILFVAFPSAAQDFPLGDDWIYVGGLLRFARGEGVHYFRDAAMPQLGQWLWAMPFIGLLGPTHVAVRISTICIAWLGIIAFYDLLRRRGLTRGQSAFAAAVLSVNPLFVLLQGTFMTDVPALSFELIALALYGRAQLGRSGRLWLAGAVVAILGVITRQTALAAPLAAAWYLYRQERPRPLVGWLAVAVPIPIGIAAHLWLQSRPDAVHLAPSVPTPGYALVTVFAAGRLCGLALLPMLALDPRPRGRRIFLVALLALVAVAAYCARYGAIFSFGGLFPSSTGVFSYGGPYTGLMAGELPPLLSEQFRIVLTALGCLVIAWLVARLTLVRAPFTAIHVLLLLVAGGFYDRYVLPIIPGVLFLGQPSLGRPRWFQTAAFATLGLFWLVSFALMHDCLAWNAARWEVGRRALNHGIEPWEIEGGFEWDGKFSLDSPPIFRPPARAGFATPFTRTFFPEVTGRFALVFRPPPQSKVLDVQPYQSWLPPGRQALRLVTREGPMPGQPGMTNRS